MGTITLAACLWDANEKSEKFSLRYDAKWALKLFGSLRRHLSIESRCVLFTDRKRDLPDFIEQIIEPDLGKNGYGDCIRPFQLNEPMIFAGLDTVIIGNCDKFARYCFEADRMALPSHPFHPEIAINGVVFCPGGQREIFDRWRGENDMEWLRQFPHNRIDAIWPGRVLSYKGHVHVDSRELPKGARIVYFHGRYKPEVLGHLEWIKRYWQ